MASLVLDLSIATALAWGWGRNAAIAYLVLGLPFLVLPFVYFRIDFLAVALALWGLALVRRNRQIAGGVLLALAIFAKVWPLALLPWFIVQRKWRALTTTLLVAAIGGMLWCAWSDTNGIMQVITFRHARGWQIESLIGGISRLVIDQPAHIESGAVRVGRVPWWASAALGTAIVVLVSWIWLRAKRSPNRSVHVRDGIVPLTAICIVVLCSPLFSPQYLLWLTPFAAIAWTRRRSAATTLIAIAVILTVLLAAGYVDLTNGHTGAETLLIARNFTLLAVVALGFRETRARSPVPEPSAELSSDLAPCM